MAQIVALGCLMLLLSGCSEENLSAEVTPAFAEEMTQGGSKKNDSKVSEASKPSKPATEYERVKEPIEGSFFVNVPKGWYNQVYSFRIDDIIREITVSVSPNSDTVIYMGDPKIPQYWSPQYTNPFIMESVKYSPLTRVEAFQKAEPYFRKYVQNKFGKLENFKLGEVAFDDERTKDLYQRHQEKGIPVAELGVVKIFFTYTDKGKPMSAHLVGATFDYQAFWIPTVCGISTSNNVKDYIPMLNTIAKSKETNPEWVARQNQIHQQRMAEIQANHQRIMSQMTDRHNQNMLWIQRSAEAHQAKMQNLWAQSDASVKSYFERSAASDMQHQRFLNYINEENTVVGSGGKTWQVATGYQRYFVNPTTGKYLGGDIRFDQDAIRRLGLNPDDYQEVKIRN
jgi:hypothetical protein